MGRGEGGWEGVGGEEGVLETCGLCAAGPGHLSGESAEKVGFRGFQTP